MSRLVASQVLLTATLWTASATPQSEPPLTTAASAETQPLIATADVEAIKARLDGTEGAALTDEQKTKVSGLIQQALEDLSSAEKLKGSAEVFRADKQNLPKTRDELAAQIVSLTGESESNPDPESSLATLETELLEKKQLLTEVQAEFDKKTSEWQARPARRETLRSNLFAQPEQLSTVKTQLQTPAPAGEPPLLSDAARAATQARLLRVQQIPEACNAELSYYDAQDTLDTPRLRRELYEKRLSRRKREVAAWDAAVQSKRQDAIGRRIDAAQEASQQAPADVRELFWANLSLAQDERKIRNDTSSVLDEQKRMDGDVVDLTKRFQQLKERDRKAAGSAALGIRLRQEREKLANPETLRRAVEARLNELEDVRLATLDKTEDLEELTHIEDVVDDFIAEHPAPLSVSDQSYRESVENAYQQRKEFLAELVKAYENYTDALNDLEQKQEELAALSEQVLNFVDERVLWIRSHRPISLTGVFSDQTALAWLGQGEWLEEPLRVLRADAWSRPELYVMFILAVALLQLRRRRQRHRLDELAERVCARSNLDIAPTLQALAVTMILSLLWPGIVAFFAYRLLESPEATQFTRNLGRNLYDLAAVVAFIEFTRHLVRVDGLADAHFDWSERSRRKLLTWVRWLCVCGIPVLLLIAVLRARESDAGGDFLERIAFVAVLLLLAWALRDLMHPRTGVFVEWSSRRAGSWTDRLRPLWSRAIQFVPIILAGLTLYGHYYTAQQLAGKLVLTLVLVLATVVTRGILSRWLMLRHRRLAIDQAKARRAALAETVTSSEESVARVLEGVEQKADLSASSEQSRRLINTSFLVVLAAAIWFVWADVLPALNRINTAPVWPAAEKLLPVVKSEQPAATGTPLPMAQPADTSFEVPTDVSLLTWGDLIQAIVALILTVTAARNVPGLLELVVLEKLPLDASVRYAVQAFARYAIVLLGMVLVSNLLGLEWSKVQWLAAALTFGLAFGLQEIFANFVSGLIILSEQPVRVGDVVTIDEVSGVVSRVRMRSTTITDWDRKEYIVPNKEFITGKLLNWTLTDSMTRIVITVGVSYSADPEHVSRVLLEIANGHDNVLEDPPPTVTFDAFGDSALNFTLRAYLPNLERRLLTIHELHTRICQRFRAEEIEIPFPQRDLNLRTLPGAVSKALREWGQEAA
ncbi:MAG: mechanosensitive ion channel [Planctomycetaceae bacterium]|nr:mechanosensitive ion channel [Planctomycetaceae bacterium]